MIRTAFLSIISLLTVSILYGQTLTLKLDTVSVLEEDTFRLKVLADTDFQEVQALQFSINWDANVLKFQENLVKDIQLGLTRLDEIAQGKIRAIWDKDGARTSLEKGTTIFEIGFKVIGTAGDSSRINITRDPLSILFLGCCDESPDNIYAPQQRLEPILEPGLVHIVPPLAIGEPIIRPISCEGRDDAQIEPEIIGGIPPYTYQWEGPNEFTATTRSIDNLKQGIYGLTVTDANQNQRVSEYEIHAATPIDFALVIQATNCDVPSGSVKIIPLGDHQPYTFDLEGELQSDTIYSGLDAGNYLLLIEDANNCEVDTIIEIGIPEGPIFDLKSSEETACLGNAIKLSPENLSNNQFYQYEWTSEDELLGTDEVIEISESGTYQLSVTDSFKCTNSASIDFQFLPQVEVTLNASKREVCQGERIDLLASTNGVDLFWSDTSGTLQVNANSIAAIAIPQYTTQYTVTAKNNCGEETASIMIETIPIEVSAGNDTCITMGTEVQLNASGGVAYQWYDSEYPLSDATIPNPISSPQDSTTYRVAITHASGCIVEDEVIVAVADDPFRFIEPINMITPNGDGINDFLEFENLGKFNNVQLKVMNRWGRTLYDKIGYQQDGELWDGTFRGKPVPDGIYFYVLIVNQIEIKQTITVLRD